MSYPARDAFILHAAACTRCRTAQPPHGYCDAGQRLYLAMYPERPGVAPAVLAWATGMALLVTVCAVLWLTGCGQATQPAASAVASPELVRVILQTDRAIQVQHDDNAIEMASAIGWPALQPLPIVVCASFTGPAGTIKARPARLWDRSACQGATR